jgi:hypothetical protein
LEEVSLPPASQIIQPVFIQNNRPINNISGSDLLINHLRNINVHEGAKYVKRTRQINNINPELINAKEVFIFKEKTVL